MFIPECHWCKIVSDLPLAYNVFLPLLLELVHCIFVDKLLDINIFHFCCSFSVHSDLY
jgi:hypothetical protein